MRRFWVRVNYTFGEAGVHNFTFSSNPDVSSLLLNEPYSINFDYNVTYPGGARIFVRPFSGGALTPAYAASGSGVYSGTGTESADFTITNGNNVHVDALRVQILSADQSVVIKEFFVPVNLYFSTVKVTNIIPTGSNFPYSNDDRAVEFNYATTEPAGVRIFPRPWTNGGLTLNYAASGSPVYNGSGAGSGTFTISTGDQRVDHVRFQVWDAGQTVLLLEMLYPVDYTFGNFLIENIQTCVPSPARLENGQNIQVRYAYYNDEGQDTRVFVRPFSGGALSPNYAASPSAAYPVGPGTIADFFTISSSDVTVDQLRFQVTNNDQSQILAEYFIPVHLVFGSGSVSTHAPDIMVDDLTVSPNPAMTQAKVTLTLHQDTKARVLLTDLLGAVVQMLPERSFRAGQAEEFDLDGAKLSAGVYFVVAVGDGFREARKLVVTK